MSRNRYILAGLMAKHSMIDLELVENVNGEEGNNEAFEKYKNGEYILKYDRYHKIVGECNDKDIPLLIADQLEYISGVMRKVNACANLFIFGFVCSIIVVIVWLISILYAMS